MIHDQTAARNHLLLHLSLLWIELSRMDEVGIHLWCPLRASSILHLVLRSWCWHHPGPSVTRLSYFLLQPTRPLILSVESCELMLENHRRSLRWDSITSSGGGGAAFDFVTSAPKSAKSFSRSANRSICLSLTINQPFSLDLDGSRTY